jgi:hypothetical protein
VKLGGEGGTRGEATQVSSPSGGKMNSTTNILNKELFCLLNRFQIIK